MKKYLAAATLLAITSAAIASPPGITGSGHDFSGGTYGSDQICIFCHTPHNAVNNNLLWNRSYAGPTTITWYTSATLTSAAKNNVLGAQSKTCLSCHDGNVAIDAFGGKSGSTMIAAQFNLGDGAGAGKADLTNDHPIGFSYANAYTQNSTGLKAAASFTASLPLYANNMECATCHDVHNKYGNSALLRKNNAASALCLACHNK